MAIVFVDVDGTLLEGRSSEAAFFVHLVAQGLLGVRQWGAAATFMARWLPTFGAHTPKKNKAYLADLPVEGVAALADAFVRDRLASRLRPHVVASIDRDRRGGAEIALLTGTPEFIARPLADIIGATLVIATVPAVDGQVFTDAPPLRHPFADAKVEEASGACRARGVELRACAAYADTVHDLALFRAVGRPVAVHPDPPLRRVARREGWEVLGDEVPLVAGRLAT